jgi:hypothetical protein
MDSVCLVNLNARIYDPTLGRFMSADGVVRDDPTGRVAGDHVRPSPAQDSPLDADGQSRRCWLCASQFTGVPD